MLVIVVIRVLYEKNCLQITFHVALFDCDVDYNNSNNNTDLYNALSAINTSLLVGALSPVNHIGWHQVWQ